MDTNMSAFGNASYMTLQDVEWQEFVEAGLPVTVFMSVLSIIGTFGNFMVILTTQRWDKRSNYRILILSLAFVDFLSCFLGIPGYIVMERFQYSIQSNVLCKISTFFHFFVGICSLNLLSFTAIERYRKTCRPFGNQFTLNQIKVICVLFYMYCLGLAAPSVFIFSSKTVETKHSQFLGKSCLLDKENKFSKIYHILFIFCLILCISICTILYCIVGRKIMLQKKYGPKMAQFRHLPGTSKTSSHESDLNVVEAHDHSLENVIAERNNARIQPLTRGKSDTCISEMHVSSTRSRDLEKEQENPPMKRKSIYDKSAQISLMFLVCSFLSCASFVSLFVFRCIEIYDSSLMLQTSNVLGPMAKILYHFHVINHVINPIVYFFINSKFRKDCTSLLRCELFCR